jgi:acyl carrier protein
VDLDSFDFLNVMVAIHDELGVDVPEVDYAKLTTLDAAVTYLCQRLGLASD